MRVTNGMMVKNLKDYLQTGMKSMDKYNKQLATGKRFSLPNEDPVGTQRSMTLNSVLNSNLKYQENIGFAQDWILNTEAAINDVNDVLQRASELAIKGANDTNSQESRDAIADEIEELNAHLLQVANTRVAGKHIFSGTATDTAAYNSTYNPGPDTYTFSTYQGDANKMGTEINSGVTVEYNIAGEDVFGPNGEVFQILENLRQNLKSGDQPAMENRIGELDGEMDGLMSILSGIGARTNRLELSSNRLETEELNLNKLIANTEDVDMAEAIMNLKMQENVFRATLASGARVIQPSLVDFLR